MDVKEATELLVDIEEQIKLSRQYFQNRIDAADAKVKLDQLLASNFLREFRAEKPNVGYEIALIMLMEKSTEAMDWYRIWGSCTAKYKGLEKILDSISTKISYVQSVMKFQLTGERNG
jgi:hypothetical protein